MPLRRETVVDAALALLDEVGLDALTTRALTDRLGVRPGALYWHVRDKRELLTAVAERIMDEVFTPDTADGDDAADAAGDAAGADWSAGAEAFAHRMRAALLRHRDGARLVATHTPAGPAALRAAEEGLERMQRAGVPLELAGHFGDTLASYVTGFVLQEQATDGRASGTVDPAARPRAAERRAPDPQARRDAAFRGGIALITGGLRVALEAGSDQV